MAGVIGKLVSSVTDVIKGKQPPATLLPSFLLLCTALQRPGTSAMDTTSKIIDDNVTIGIDPGANPDGSPNMVNEYTYNVVKRVFEAMKMDGSVQCVLPAASLSIVGEGANSGGPVVIHATNILPLTIKGIFN